MKLQIVLACLLSILCGMVRAQIAPAKSTSFYTQKVDDPDAVFFTPEAFNITADGKTDVSDALQEAINQVKTNYNFGILFIPEGKYLISKTIYIPQAVRVIGYGQNRPLFILKSHSPGFQEPDETDKGKAKYMFWFTNAIVRPGQQIQDANASTFYSALSNVDILIENGNGSAVALRAHFAQHSFISHVDVYTGTAKADLFDVGNEMEDVRFFGGDYGIYTTKPAPGWQFMTVDTYFEGQRKAAIKTQEAGLTIVRMNVRNVPVVIDIDSNYYEKLFMENCRFENVGRAAVSVGLEGSAANQINLRDINLSNVPTLAYFKGSGKKVQGIGPVYHVSEFTHGLQMDGLRSGAMVKTTQKMSAMSVLPAPAKKDIPDLPAMNTWVNLKSLGARGDGTTDDTKIIQEAVDKFQTIYVPQGWYVVSETIKLKPASVLIGLNPIGSQFILKDNTPAFSGFGAPKPLIEVPRTGTNIVSGIGLYTGVYNQRAVACKWMAGENSYMNDVKFVGGHGTMEHPAPPREPNVPRGNGSGSQQLSRMTQGMDEAWDSNYWSLWITNGGGGTFKDLWSANSFANAGVYVSNTTTPGRMYAVSVEHHVRNEVTFSRASNWKVYALQTEEENREGSYALPLELIDCSNMIFGNLYMYRVTRVILPYEYGVRIWGSKNIDFLNLHNFAQTKYPSTVPVYDVNSNTEVRPWEFARLRIAENSFEPAYPTIPGSPIKQLAKGFEFANALAKNGKGDLYFAESRLKRIYRWSPKTNSLSILMDIPWEPLALGFDKNDNLLVVFKSFQRPGTAATSIAGGGGYTGFNTLAYTLDPSNPEESIRLLEKVPMGSLPVIYKALYPGNRGVGFYNSTAAALNPAKEAFVASDGSTIIPIVPDLYRANSLQEAWPGKTVYSSDEMNRRTAQYSVGADGSLTNRKPFAERGEFSSVMDVSGNVYIADGEIYVYDRFGKQIRVIKTPERPTILVLGGADGKTLFFTSRAGLYSTRVQ